MQTFNNFLSKMKIGKTSSQKVVSKPKRKQNVKRAKHDEFDNNGLFKLEKTSQVHRLNRYYADALLAPWYGNLTDAKIPGTLKSCAVNRTGVVTLSVLAGTRRLFCLTPDAPIHYDGVQRAYPLFEAAVVGTSGLIGATIGINAVTNFALSSIDFKQFDNYRAVSASLSISNKTPALQAIGTAYGVCARQGCGNNATSDSSAGEMLLPVTADYAAGTASRFPLFCCSQQNFSNKSGVFKADTKNNSLTVRWMPVVDNITAFSSAPLNEVCGKRPAGVQFETNAIFILFDAAASTANQQIELTYNLNYEVIPGSNSTLLGFDRNCISSENPANTVVYLTSNRLLDPIVSQEPPTSNMGANFITRACQKTWGC